MNRKKNSYFLELLNFITRFIVFFKQILNPCLKNSKSPNIESLIIRKKHHLILLK